ncbi:MAG: sensor histidine kinase [Velocimicrobium sp.]
MYHRIRKRLTLLCSLVIAIIVFGMTLFCLKTVNKQIKEKGYASFARDVNGICYYMRSQTVIDHTWLSQTESEYNIILSIQINETPLLYSSIRDNQKRLQLIHKVRTIAGKKYGLNISNPPNNKLNNEDAQFTFKDDNNELYYGAAALIPIDEGWIGLLIVKDKKAELAQLFALSRSFIGVAVITLFVFGILTWIFIGYILKPLEENKQKQNEFVHAASHELRSPLSIIKTSLSVIPQASKEESIHFCQLADEECSRMSRLIDDMLILAGSDSKSYPIYKEETEIETILLITYERFLQQAHRKEIKIKLIAANDPMPKCNCDKERILQVLAILFDNAICYTQAGGTIIFFGKKIGKEIQITVMDNGAGIEKKYRKAVFERFYRKEVSRSDREHFGLGLSIAREIILLHRGKIILEEAPGGGSLFRILIPIT